jgi:hypothetical protein
MRLLSYYKHRYYTFVQIMKDSMRARRVAKVGSVRPGIDDEEEKGQPVKVFSLKP